MTLLQDQVAREPRLVPVTLPETSALTPMQVAVNLIAGGASVEAVEKMLALSERLAADQSRRAFDAAIAEAKAEITPVVKNRTGHNEKRYADFSAIAKAVDPIISKHGLSYRFRSAQSDRISVTCILSHKEGHFEETTLSGPPDASGSKNAIQAIGSTLTYLQRYTLVQALGLAATEDDDDGRAAGIGMAISDQQRQRLDALFDETAADLAKFLAYFKIEFLAELPSAQFGTAVAMLEQKRKKVPA